LDAKQFGVRLRQAREQLGLSQEDLAVLVGKDQRSISEYETGKRRLSVTDLPALAAALKVSILFFFDESEDKPELEQAVLYYFHVLPTPAAQHTAVDILQILARSFQTSV
jgi:transcriptional regulator with XRE-family HTH domain